MYELGLRGGYSSPLFPPRDLSQFQSGQPCLDREREASQAAWTHSVFTGPWTGAKQPGLVDERRARGGEQEDEGRRRVGGGGQEEGRRKRAEGKVNTVFMSGWNLLEGYSVYITVDQTHWLF